MRHPDPGAYRSLHIYPESPRRRSGRNYAQLRPSSPPGPPSLADRSIGSTFVGNDASSRLLQPVGHVWPMMTSAVALLAGPTADQLPTGSHGNHLRTTRPATIVLSWLVVVAWLLPPPLVCGMQNGAGRQPPLGWSTWETCGEPTCGHDICNEAEVQSAALALASSGLQALGWKHILLDDCWAATERSAAGELQWDRSRFPAGIPALAHWLHSRGFLLGLCEPKTAQVLQIDAALW